MNYKSALLALAISFSASAQVAGRLSGTVADPSGGRLAGASVELFLSGGQTPITAAATNAEGVFDFVALRPAAYEIRVTAPGFHTAILKELKVDPARQTALAEIRLDLAATAETVEVSAGSPLVETATFEVTSTVTNAQVEALPLADRQIVNLFYTQPGVSQNGATITVINGLRPSYSNVTLDGINVQDNFVRTNTLDYQPNRLTIAQVAEMTVSSSNSDVSLGGGANQIVMVSRSGTNQLHGDLYWYNRNSAFAANSWFGNRAGVDRPQLNLNQIGAAAGGPVIRDKLFFYGNYEAYRRHATRLVRNTILTPAARQGVLTYRDAAGATQTFDLLRASGLTVDPRVRALIDATPAQGNSNEVGDGLNTTGYLFNAQANVIRDIVLAKADYYVNAHHAIASTVQWNRDDIQRADTGNFYTQTPPVTNANRAQLLSAAWRWSATPSLTNELRGGYNHMNVPFLVAGQQPDLVFGGTLSFTSPVNEQLEDLRGLTTYSIQDNASLVRGRHTLRFGYQGQFARGSAAVFAGIAPRYTIGLATNSPFGFNAGAIPGLRNNDLANANRLLATLGGIVSGGTQAYNLTSRTSGFVPGVPRAQNWIYDTHSFYLGDTWRVRPRLTLSIGLRWDYYAPVDERDALIVQPVPVNGNAIEALLTNATLDFAGKAVGRPFYRREWNNFAPNVGFAWDPWGTGKTSLRGGYSIGYVSDNAANDISNATAVNGGLVGTATWTNQHATLAAPLSLAPPPFEVPVTTARNHQIQNLNSAQGMVDPRLATPYVQQWSFGIQREILGTVVEARYVGNHAVGLLRQIDYNQVRPREGGFLDDFIRARNNGFLAQSARGVFAPAYDPSIPGSQPLPVFDSLPGRGFLTNATVTGQLLRGEAGTLAQTFASVGAAIPFFPNPNTLYSSLITNQSHSVYNSGQIEVRRSLRSGFHFQGSYVFGKVLTDATALRGLDEILDNNNWASERSRATFDVTHVFKFNHVVPLPFGITLSGFLNFQSGAPVPLYSARGTLNRGARSPRNPVSTTFTAAELNPLVGFFQTGDGPRFVHPSAIGPDGRGVAADGAQPFSGQLFFNPGPGEIGSLQRRMFDGPGFANYDFSIAKRVRLRERHAVEVRADFFNLTNRPNFTVTETNTSVNVNNTNFGRVLSMASGERTIQFGLYYRF